VGTGDALGDEPTPVKGNAKGLTSGGKNHGEGREDFEAARNFP